MDAKLADAIVEWEATLLGNKADFLTPSDVISAFNDITIDSGIRPANMPKALCDIYVEAVARNKEGRENFAIVGLRYTVAETLSGLRELV